MLTPESLHRVCKFQKYYLIWEIGWVEGSDWQVGQILWGWVGRGKGMSASLWWGGSLAVTIKSYSLYYYGIIWECWILTGESGGGKGEGAGYTYTLASILAQNSSAIA